MRDPRSSRSCSATRNSRTSSRSSVSTSSPRRTRSSCRRARRIQRFLSQNTYVAKQFTGIEGSTVPVEETDRGVQQDRRRRVRPRGRAGVLHVRRPRRRRAQVGRDPEEPLMHGRHDLQVELVAADREVWSGEATMVIARTIEGEIGILADHEPVLSLLVDGVGRRQHGRRRTWVAAVDGGLPLGGRQPGLDPLPSTPSCRTRSTSRRLATTSSGPSACDDDERRGRRAEAASGRRGPAIRVTTAGVRADPTGRGGADAGLAVAARRGRRRAAPRPRSTASP